MKYVRHLLTALMLAAAAALYAQMPTPWQDPNASYRLELTTDHPEDCAGFPLGRLLLPADPENGLTVFDGKGNRLAFSYSKNNGFLVIAPSPADPYRLVYFGLAKPGEVKSWAKHQGSMPGDEPLVMEISHSRIDYDRIRERFKKRNRPVDASALAGYFNPRRYIRDTIVTGQVRLDRVPKRYRRRIGVVFRGMLKIDRAGEYTFAADSNSSMMLEVDGRPLIFRFGEEPRTGNWKRRATIKLRPGSHPFRFCYHYNDLDPNAEAVWRGPGDRDFKPLLASDFYPGWPASSPLLVDRRKNRLPLAGREFLRTLQVGKEEKLYWLRYGLPPHYAGTAQWTVDGQAPIKGRQADFLLKDPDAQRLVLTPGSASGFSPVQGEPRRRYQEEVIVYPDLYLKLFAPLMVFDDEAFNLTFEVISSLPGICYPELTFRPDRANPVWEKTDLKLALNRKTDSLDDEFAPAAAQKTSFTIPAAAITAPLRLEVALAMAGRPFDRRDLAFAPWKDIVPGSLKAGEDGFRDADGRRVIPILHRPSLAERRTWALPRQLAGILKKPRKLLLVADADSNERLAEILQRQLEPAGTKVEVRFWPGGTSQLSKLLESFIAIAAAVRQTDADALIVMPPALDHWSWLPADTLPLLLSGVLGEAIANPSLRSAALTTPPPSPLVSEMVADRLSGTIKKLARDYEVRLLDLNAVLNGGNPAPAATGSDRTADALLQCWR